MAQTIINVGVIANDGTGDGIRLAGTSINTNFTELFNRPSVLSHIAFDGNNITSFMLGLLVISITNLSIPIPR
jgi:hypothetical protein